MTVSHRIRAHQPDEIQTINEPGLQIECDGCAADLTHSVRMKCADPACEPGNGDAVDICPRCFCEGKEFGRHKRWHAYRVVELHSYPIFEEDWGADEEILLIEGLSLQGLGNWQAIAEHVGTRTKEQVAEHYHRVYINSPGWPLPRMDQQFDVDPATFHERKRRRISTMDTIATPLPKVAPTSAPAVHEVAGFLPGRLEFEHEVENEAEDLIKDLEFGVCLEWGGGDMVEDENDPDVKARAKWIEERRAGKGPAMKGAGLGAGKGPGKRGYPGGKVPGKTAGKGSKGKGVSAAKQMFTPNGTIRSHALKNGVANGANGAASAAPGREETKGRPSRHAPMPKEEEEAKKNGGEEEGEGEGEDEVTQPPPIETKESLEFKLALIEMYQHRVDKRKEHKEVIFDRGLLEYKKMQAADKKRPKEEKDIVHRLRPFARLMTADDFESFCTDILYESMLRKRIQELQHYRRMGLRTAADIDKYDNDVHKRAYVKTNTPVDYYATPSQRRRHGSAGMDVDDPDVDMGTPRPAAPAPAVRKAPAPLNLANSPHLHLLTPAEQTLCSALRILPKPYLVIKETLVREYARRGGKLRRREARDLVKIDVNKTSRIWDFLVQAGFLRINLEQTAAGTSASTNGTASASGSPTKGAVGPSASTSSMGSAASGSSSVLPALVPAQPPPS
ncbi:SWIRM-domain-containing protein [Punctularia strigosozonata HHB-11173 SS5]|uniref:SWIRM-domain-containing protein n=1 Tax=Punctularia strigosozonata (strain HHB-11173) TaxID=741275 RepID=UPI0004417562|nr:SWIRM-domain-containing protein [Punctularia strigosozonata HHB-11173 SS5]EIN11553.1 SWIRM-domain-containing protein [Punctularia strigosozonata HHB-11173 SS5]